MKAESQLYSVDLSHLQCERPIRCCEDEYPDAQEMISTYMRWMNTGFTPRLGMSEARIRDLAVLCSSVSFGQMILSLPHRLSYEGAAHAFMTVVEILPDSTIGVTQMNNRLFQAAVLGQTLSPSEVVAQRAFWGELRTVSPIFRPSRDIFSAVPGIENMWFE